jgi:hypothetical protein
MYTGKVRYWVWVIAIFAGCSAASGQGFEASASFGWTTFPGGSKYLGTATNDPATSRYRYDNGFQFALRMTVNSWTHLGWETGYAYNRTKLHIPAGAVLGSFSGFPGFPGQTFIQETPVEISLPMHQVFFNMLVYATPEGTRVRPFLAGGGGFNSFTPPGSSVYYGNQSTKFGLNYGGGMKFRFSENWGFRLDGRYFWSAKPFFFPNRTGYLMPLELTAGVSFSL